MVYEWGNIYRNVEEPTVYPTYITWAYGKSEMLDSKIDLSYFSLFDDLSDLENNAFFDEAGIENADCNQMEGA